MKQLKKQLAYVAMMSFAILTAYVIIYAYHHRDKDDLVYVIFNSYALVAVILSFIFVLYWQHVQNRKRVSSQKRLRALVRNLTEPAMLWDDALKTVVLNEALLNLTELREPEDGFDAKYVVPWIFGKKEITDADIREIVLTKNKEYELTVKSGSPHNIIWNTSSVHTDDDGLTVFLSIGFDLANIRMMESELKDYSQRLAASERRYMLTMELTDVGILLIEQGNRKLYPSEKLRQMIGIPGETWTVEDIRARVYPMDLTLFDNHVQTVRNQMGRYLNETQVLELRVCGPDNRYRWYSYRFKALQREGSPLLSIGGSVIDITKEKEKDARIEQIAYEDSVTRIPNRNRLIMMGQELFQCTAELGSSYWVIVTDIDRFHLINDTCGYANGNELLRSFADILTRQINNGGYGGFAARISGDNFAMILRDGGDEQLPQKILSKVQRSLATQAVGPFENHALTCSAGYAKMPRDGSTFEQVLEHAEFALSTGVNTMGSITPYTTAMHDKIIEDTNLEKQLSDGIMKGELELWYQPKVSLESGAVMGVEALIRWRRPDGTIIGPDRFIPMAERSQLITHITRFVLFEACRQAMLWQKLGLPQVVMSINMTSVDFYQDNVCALVRSALEKYGMPPELLEIELTESIALRDIDLTVARMNELRQLGVQIAMDDFGTGYSSLSYIQRLPFTMLKLDRSFVLHMEDDIVVQEIVSSVVRIARAKSIRTIAEGVETPEQAKQLRLSGCDYAQGFLYSRPMVAASAEQFLRQNQRERKVY